MSRDIGMIKNAGSQDDTLIVTAFYGGDEKGVCFQITDSKLRYITLTPKDLMTLGYIVGNYLVEVNDDY